ncbi:hypothetical protein MCOR02_000939 [Pyricularia oryzae]|nr:hypothetical protein MCOR02_000939 [Pyricularia oryzae]KAI6306195.1 hypothetical protein MCOR34_008163 [Pyricularia oryzae]KAI6449155.1 hypothetical protein MCOR17_010227 [Pyricularia oryzae]KAI6505124.1 hypothetical protein MCOR13_004456 [Pyricularia oryzae]KAI6551334.1 hypothetical protein MCOR04_011070 [Pyricularia oryzae]
MSRRFFSPFFPFRISRCTGQAADILRYDAILFALPPTPRALDSFYSALFRSASAADDGESSIVLRTAYVPASVSSVALV